MPERQSTGGPFVGNFSRMPDSRQTESRAGPSHCGQSSANSALPRRNEAQNAPRVMIEIMGKGTGRDYFLRLPAGSPLAPSGGCSLANWSSSLTSFFRRQSSVFSLATVSFCAGSLYKLCSSSGSFTKSYISHWSEEHTSELQSLRHLVCRLLLEKKK